MSHAFQEGTQTFTFPPTWRVIQYDLTNHYRESVLKWSFHVRLTKSPETWSKDPIGQKAVDFAAVDTLQNHLVLIEVKDYRVGATVVPSRLPDVFAQKVRDTLFGLALAVQDPHSDARTVGQALPAASVHAYLDVCWPASSGALAPRPNVMRTNLLQKISQTMPALVTAHVVDRSVPTSWTVT